MWAEMAQPFTRAWQGLERAHKCRAVVEFYRQSSGILSTECERLPIRKAAAMQRGGLVRTRFKRHLSSASVVSGELVQKQVVPPVSERNSVV